MIKTSKMSNAEFAAFLITHPVSGAKGDSTAEDTEKSQAQFTNTLQNAFATNNANQQAQLAFLNKQLQEGITNPQGYSPETLAAMRTQATEQAATNNKNVLQAVNNKFATQGDATTLPSGVQEQIAAGVGSEIANNEANQQLGITEQNGELQNQNYWRAVQGEQGVAEMENPEGFAGATNNAAGTVGNLSEAVTKAKGPGIGSILGGIVGAGLGAAGSFLNKPPSGSGFHLSNQDVSDLGGYSGP